MQEYVRFTKRIPITQDFTPSEEEQRLYDKVSDYLIRPDLFALPASQRALVTLVLRKLLASSTFAIAGTLNALAKRLTDNNPDVKAALIDDYETAEELSDEWEASDEPIEGKLGDQPPAPPNVVDEVRELRGFSNLATSINENAKGAAPLSALQSGFGK